MMKPRLTLPLSIVLLLVSTSCTQKSEPPASTPSQAASAYPTTSSSPDASGLVLEENPMAFSTDEIRLLPTQTELTAATRIDIPLSGEPAWVAGLPFEEGTAWVVALADGGLKAFSIDDSGYAKVPISPDVLPPGMPLTVYTRAGALFALAPPGPDASPLTVAQPVAPDVATIAYIAQNGDLVIWQTEGEMRLPVNALPDSRILSDTRGRLLLLSHPTDRYAHGALGDGLEATRITLVDTLPTPRILQTISIPDSDVIEGISPLWTDLNGDNELEIIVTLSNDREGARIAAFREDGSILAQGPAIGSGFRWRHQLLVAPFGTSGEKLLAVVRTPHIGGVLEFYRLEGTELRIVSEIPGISTHSIGSRNLITAQAGDFDSDGHVELLAPDQSHTRLGLFGLDGAPETWIPLGARLNTNLAAVHVPETSQVVVAAGLSDNRLSVWIP